MHDKNDINSRIEETLNSLEGMRRAEANPFIYTRIMTRVRHSTNSIERLVGIAGKPVFAVMLLVVVLSTNLLVMLNGSTETTTVNEPQTQFAIADEYHNQAASLYDYENPEP